MLDVRDAINILDIVVGLFETYIGGLSGKWKKREKIEKIEQKEYSCIRNDWQDQLD